MVRDRVTAGEGEALPKLLVSLPLPRVKGVLVLRQLRPLLKLEAVLVSLPTGVRKGVLLLKDELERELIGVGMRDRGTRPTGCRFRGRGWDPTLLPLVHGPVKSVGLKGLTLESLGG